ncbi:973_t:CDS:1, partial [Paraglomus brasilianum]
PVTKREIEEYTYAENEQKTKRIKNMATPSSFCKPKEMLKVLDEDPLMCNHRPHDPDIPITLYHSTFARFQENRDKAIVTKEDCALVIELVERMEKTFRYESERQREFHSWASEYLNLAVGKLPLPEDHQEADIGAVAIVGQLSFTLLVGEIKNEIGEGGGCAYVQACASYTKVIGLNNSNIVRQGLNPTFLLYLSGPYLGIGGAVLGKDFTMEPLTPIFPLLFMKNDPNAMEDLARALVALKTGLQELNHYYQARYGQARYIDPSNHLREDSFPYVRKFVTESGEFGFSYVKPICSGRPLFLVRGKSGDFQDKLMVVKFTKRYGIDGHNYCARQKVAPEVYAYNHIPGWIMVVMEYLSEEEYITAHTAIHAWKRDRKVLLKKAEDTVSILHAGGFAIKRYGFT